MYVRRSLRSSLHGSLNNPASTCNILILIRLSPKRSEPKVVYPPQCGRHTLIGRPIGNLFPPQAVGGRPCIAMP